MTELQDLRVLFTASRPETQLVQNAVSEAGPSASEQDVLNPTKGHLPPIPIPSAAKAPL